MHGEILKHIKICIGLCGCESPPLPHHIQTKRHWTPSQMHEQKSVLASISDVRSMFSGYHDRCVNFGIKVLYERDNMLEIICLRWIVSNMFSKIIG